MPIFIIHQIQSTPWITGNPRNLCVLNIAAILELSITLLAAPGDKIAEPTEENVALTKISTSSG